MDWHDVWTRAKNAGHAAALAQDARLTAELGDKRQGAFDCGFAWVTVRPARGPLLREPQRYCIAAPPPPAPREGL
jgi:hypothetical protein